MAEDYLPLARAAGLAHERLYPEQTHKETKTLDVLALALSALLPLYQRDMQSGAVRRERRAPGDAIQRLMEDSLIAARLRLTMRPIASR